MLYCIQKTEVLRMAVAIALSIAAQLAVCTILYEFCCQNEFILEDKKLNVQLIAPVEEIEIPEIKKELKIEEEVIEMVQKEYEPEQVIPEDPFEKPLEIEKPVIPEKPKTEIKKKQVQKQEPKKVVEKIEEPKPVVVVEEIPRVQHVVTPEKPAKTEQKPVEITKPVLTKAQINENSKYLTRVMKIFEKNKKYPESARRQHMEGKIIVEFAISKDGKTENVKAKTSTPKELAEAAENLVKNSKLPVPPSSWPIGASAEIPISYKIK